METCTIKDFNTFSSIPLISDNDLTAIMNKKKLENEYSLNRQSSSSSICAEEVEIDYLILFNETDDEKNLKFDDVDIDNFKQLSLESCKSESNLLINKLKSQYELENSNNSYKINYFDKTKDDLSQISKVSEKLFSFKQFDLPMRTYVSKPDLNTPDEIRLIEDNVRMNSLLTNLRYTNSDDSLSDDFNQQYVDESDDEICYKRITSEYPLMLNTLETPSDGSLVAVVDFDISDNSTKHTSHDSRN